MTERARSIERSALSIPWKTLLLGGLWAWAIWACAEHWQGNPNYSYGWVVPVLAFFFGLRRYLSWPGQSDSSRRLGSTIAFSAAGLGLLVFLLEYAREEMWHPEIVLWSLCFLVVAATLGIFWSEGGWPLVKAEAFPVLFFLTAVPWPPRIEQPITSALMRAVAGLTTEILHWLGIEAQTSGGAIALQSGLVGITEACSGIRSLQAGIMFGLAMGEWFLLRPVRRIVLLGLAVLLALVSNLVRTLTLALQAERHGADSIDRIHDLVGNITITALIVGIWLAGKFLSNRPAEGSLTEWRERGRRLLRGLFAPASIGFAAAAVALLAGIFSAHFVYAQKTANDQTQTRARFSFDGDSANHFGPVRREVWNELRPTSAEYVRYEDDAFPGGGADCYHFFWKPSAWNRFALVHRPDICMPGIGWAPNGPVESVETKLDGHDLRLYLFRFRRGRTHALELWGAWRNGEPVPLDYSLEQVFGTMPPPANLQLEGKRRSATEIVSCSVIANGAEPTREMALALLAAVFHYKPDE